MSNDLSYIIRHNFHDVSNHEACMQFLMQTSERLKKHFGVDWATFIGEDMIEPGYCYEMYVAPLDVTLQLQDGCWLAMTHRRYSWYFNPSDDGHIYFREGNFDLCRTFGQIDGYVADDNAIDNIFSDILDTESFEQWLNDKSMKLPEYDMPEWMAGNKTWEDYAPRYHDSFKEYPAVLKYLQERFPDYEILTIRHHGDFIYAKREGRLYLLNTRTGVPLNDFDIDFIYFDIDGFEIGRNGEYAFYDYNGNRIIGFSKEGIEFVEASQKWDKYGCDRLVYDLSTDIYYYKNTPIPSDKIKRTKSGKLIFVSGIKIILYLPGITSSGQCEIVNVLRDCLEDKAMVIGHDLSVHPQAALAEIKDGIKRWKPDLIIGSSCGGMYASMLLLKRIKMILINPQKSMVGYLKSHMGINEYKSPRYDKKKTFEVTPELVDEFERLKLPEIDKHKQENIWTVLGDNDSLQQWRNEDFQNVVRFPGGHTMNADEVREYLVPLCKSVLEIQ